MSRSNASKLDERRTEVARLILNGYSTSKIYELAVEWGLTTRTIDTYIAQAKETIKKINQWDVEFESALQRQRLEDNYQMARRKGDLKQELAAIKTIIDLRGLAAPEKHQIESTVTHKGEMEEIRKLVADIAAHGADARTAAAHQLIADIESEDNSSPST